MKKTSSKWHAVTVVLHGPSCAAAALCRNSRFLSRSSALPLRVAPPAMPLHFRHYEDRRNGPRRTDDVGGELQSTIRK